MAETLLTTCVAAAGLTLVSYLRSGRLAWLAATACACAAAAYVKPVAYFLPLALALGLTAASPRARIAPAIVFAIIAAALLAPWHMRNAIVGGYAGFSTQMDGTIGLSNRAALVAAREHRPFSDVRREHDEYRVSGPTLDGSYAAARQRGLDAMLAAPGTYAWIHAKGMFRVLFHPGAMPYLELYGLEPDHGGVGAIVLDEGSTSAFLRARREDPLVFWTTIAMSVVLLPYLGLPAIGFWRRRFRWSEAHLLVAGVAVYFVVVSGGPWGQSRFRHPLVPALSVLAGFAFHVEKSHDEPRD